MIELTLPQIAAAVGGRVLGAPEQMTVSGEVVTDSREVTPGGLFVALRGARVDGHHYLADAAGAGAVAALVTRHVPQAPLAQIQVRDTTRALGDLARAVLSQLRTANPGPQVVAITGSVGKTSTKDLIAAQLEGLGEVIAPVGSYNNEVGLPLTVLRANADTRVLVLEMGADAPGNLTYLASIAPPDLSLVLAVGRAHLGGFGSIEAVAEAKTELVTTTPADGTVVLNADDPRVAAMASASPAATLVRFGQGEDADVRAADIRLDAEGRAQFVLAAGGRQAQVHLALIGAHHVTNALAAASVALQLGQPLEQVAQVLGTTFARSPHRMQVHRTEAGVKIIDDAYNANPDSMRAALRALVQMTRGTGGRSVAVLGPMRELGPDSADEHRQVGVYAAQVGVDHLLAVEGEARPVADGALAAGLDPQAAVRATGITEAVTSLRRYLRSGDVVLVKASNGVQLWRVVSELERSR